MRMAMLDLVGSSTNFRPLLDDIDVVAPVDSDVLIQEIVGTSRSLKAVFSWRESSVD
jgi:transcriptional regulator with GAF, ATPase, and Fis domain